MAAKQAFPKTPGACLDKLLVIDIQRDKLKEALEKKVKTLNAEYDALEAHVFSTFKNAELDGGKGSKAIAEIHRTPVANVKDWEKLWAYIAKKKAWDLLQKRVNNTAYRDRLDAKERVPGVETFNKVTLKVRPIKKRK